MSEEMYDWSINIVITANAKTKLEYDALVEMLMSGLQALKDANLINYADYTIDQKFQKREGKVG